MADIGGGGGSWGAMEPPFSPSRTKTGLFCNNTAGRVVIVRGSRWGRLANETRCGLGYIAVTYATLADPCSQISTSGRW